MPNETKLIEYTFTEKDDDGHNNRVHTITKRAIFLDPKDSKSGVGFLIVKSNWGNGPLMIYLIKHGKKIESFFFGDNFGTEGFPIPGQLNSDSWNKIKILSSENVLSDKECEILVSYFNITRLNNKTKKSIWDTFKGRL